MGHPVLVDSSKYEYRLMCDKGRHTVLFVEDANGRVSFISKRGKEVGLHKLPSNEFNSTYTLEYQDYPLRDYAQRTLNLAQLGVAINTTARRHLDAIIRGELMAKPAAPVTSKTAVQDPKAKPAKEAKPKAAPVVAPEEGGEPKTRNRREKLDSGAKIKVIGKNPARVGTTRHAIVETIFKARTVAEAMDSTVTRKDGTEYKIGAPDLYFALENELITIG